MNNKVKIAISIILALGLIIPVAIFAISAALEQKTLPFYILPLLGIGGINLNNGNSIEFKNVGIYSATHEALDFTTRINYNIDGKVHSGELFKMFMTFDVQAFGVQTEDTNVTFRLSVLTKTIKQHGETISIAPFNGTVVLSDKKGEGTYLTSGKININTDYYIGNDNLTQYIIDFNFTAQQWKNYWNSRQEGMYFMTLELELSLDITSPYPTTEDLLYVDQELWLSDFIVKFNDVTNTPDPGEPSVPDPGEPSVPDPGEPSAPDPDEPSVPDPGEPSVPDSGDCDHTGNCDCDEILEQIRLEILVLQDIIQIAIDGSKSDFKEALKEALKEHFDDIQQVIDNNADTIADALSRQADDILNADESAEPISGEEQAKSNIEAHKSIEDKINSMLPEFSIDNKVIGDILIENANAFELIQYILEQLMVEHVYLIVMFSLLLGLALFILGKRQR